MYIQKIKINNFKSIYDSLEIDFNNIQGFWKISGPVGSGKTTIGEAVIFGLFGSINGKNNSDLISWGEKHSLIELWCTSKGHNLYIKRELNSYGQSPVYVEVDGEELVFTNKRDAQIQLEKEYYDTTRTALEMLCIISFNNFKSVATLNSQDTKKFLDQVFGFYILTQYTEICRFLKNDNINIINTIKGNAQNIKSQIDKINELTSKSIIEGDEREIEKEIEDIKKELNENIEIYNNNIKKLTEEIQDKKQNMASLITLGKNKKKEIDFIKKGKCPTCGAPIDQSRLKDKEKEREELLEAYNTIHSTITLIEAHISREKDEMNKYISEGKDRVKIKENLLIRLREQAKRSLINFEEVEKLQKELIKLDEEYNKYIEEGSAWDRLYNILSCDIRSKILSNFIPVINNNILKYTSLLQQPYIITFDENFKCIINMCGYKDPIPLSSLSTGQLKTVDMIIILGVLGAIIGSSSINIMFLDELFSNLDESLRNDMCKVLKDSVKSNNTLFIVSHQDIDEQFFNGFIDLSLENMGDFKKKSCVNITYNG